MLKKESQHPSKNDYDWLGHGMYFWENDPHRALQYAKEMRDHPERCSEVINNPAVIGAIIDLGRCLNLFDQKALDAVKDTYNFLIEDLNKRGEKIPENSKSEEEVPLRRKLDCAVIQTLHTIIDVSKEKPYDTVRSPFWEGRLLYPNAGFREKNHIQICVRNLNNIKGYFLPIDGVSRSY